MNATKAHITINIRINDDHYKVHEDEMTGTALKNLAGIPSANLLFREVHGPGDDEQISDSTAVHLHNSDRFYDMPPGNFGRR
jgi:Multiubiquitin